jgi:hypothetical protein
MGFLKFKLNERLRRYSHTDWAAIRDQEMKDFQAAALKALLYVYGDQLEQ